MDPRVWTLMSKYAKRKGDFLLGRRETSQRSVDPDIFAGWALSKTNGDVLRAIELVRGMPAVPPTQRKETLSVLRGLIVVFDLTKPMIEVAHR
jgi:hypothetical protein